MNFHFKDDTAPAFKKTRELSSTKSDHYGIPSIVPCQIIHSQNFDITVTLPVQTNSNKEKIILKLH